MCKGGAVSFACIIKFAYYQGILIGDTEWNANYARYMQFEKKFAGNKLYAMFEGQEMRHYSCTYIGHFPLSYFLVETEV
jgi:hypothetical protein